MGSVPCTGWGGLKGTCKQHSVCYKQDYSLDIELCLYRGHGVTRLSRKYNSSELAWLKGCLHCEAHFTGIQFYQCCHGCRDGYYSAIDRSVLPGTRIGALLETRKAVEGGASGGFSQIRLAGIF